MRKTRISSYENKKLFFAKKQKDMASLARSATTLLFESHFIPAKVKSDKLMIVLHGRGDTLKPFRSFDTELKTKNLNFLLLNAHRKFLTGRSWYAEPPQQRASLERLRMSFFKLIHELNIQGWKTKNIFLLGFSQGGLVAADLVLHYPEAFAGIIGVSSYFHFTPRWKRQMPGSTRKTSWLYTHGTRDDILPIEITQFGIEKLKAAGIKVEWIVSDKKHVFDLSDYKVIREWIEKKL